METKAEFQTYWVLQFESILTQVHRPSSDAVEICTSRNTTLQQIWAQAIKGAWHSRLLTQIYTLSKKTPPPPPSLHIYPQPLITPASPRLDYKAGWDYENIDLMVSYQENAKIKMFARLSKLRNYDVIQRWAVSTK